jgi:hypothetical protein
MKPVPRLFEPATGSSNTDFRIEHVGTLRANKFTRTRRTLADGTPIANRPGGDPTIGCSPTNTVTNIATVTVVCRRAGQNVTTLTFRSSPIRRYHAQFMTDLNTAMTNLLSFDGQGGVISITHTNGSGGFYRLQAPVP